MFKSVTSGPPFEPQYSLQYSIDVVEHPDFVTTMDGVRKCYQDLEQNGLKIVHEATSLSGESLSFFLYGWGLLVTV
jgi:hypothetical protein